MPIYSYMHDEASDCQEPVEVFQRMMEDALAICPHCNKSIYKILSTVRFAVKAAPFDEGKAFKNHYSHKLRRPVEKGEQLYEVPTMPSGLGGEVVKLTGMTSGEQERAIHDAHVRAKDERVLEGGKVELTK